MPTMLSVLPVSLSLPAGSASTYDEDGIAFDFAVGGVPFLSAARESRFLERKTAPFRKQQFDSAANAGEQTLSGWWYRSQLSFHGGAGQRYIDPSTSDPSVETRFYSSAGVDVWTQGKVSLLPDTETLTHATVSQGVSYTASGRDVAFFAGGSTAATVFSNAGTDGTSTGAWWAGTAPTTCTTNGTLVYAASTDGIYSTPAVYDVSASVWTKVWNSGSSNNAIAWVKQRLVAGIGPSIYELVGGAPPTLQTAKYTHPNSSWQWTSISETSNSIYAAGYAGAVSAIYKFTLITSDGSMPQLTSGIVAAQLPYGEVVHSIYGYLGIYLCIGTSKGVRIAVANESGDLEYGPLIVELTNPVYQWAGRDRFVWFTTSAGIDGKSGTYRVDLGNQIGNLRFAYASDFYSTASTGTVKACAFLGATNRVAFADQATIYYAHVTDLISSGSLTTSRVRFSTLEPKLFKLARLRGPTLLGSLSLATLDQTDVETPIITVSGQDPGSEDISLHTPASAQEFISLKFTLARGAVNTDEGAEMYGYQLKALPGTARKRVMVLPFLCFDREKDQHGAVWGYEGNAIERLEALEELEDAGNTVFLQDLRRDRTYECTIEDIRFVQTSPPPNSDQTWGGFLFLTVRTN
jgi:hypothetical protein